MSVIYKYDIPFDNDGVAVVEHDWALNVLNVKFQNSLFGHGFKVWMEVDPERGREKTTFHMVMTGQEVPIGEYVCSVENNQIVAHIYRGPSGR